MIEIVTGSEDGARARRRGRAADAFRGLPFRWQFAAASLSMVLLCIGLMLVPLWINGRNEVVSRYHAQLVVLARTAALAMSPDTVAMIAAEPASSQVRAAADSQVAASSQVHASAERLAAIAAQLSATLTRFET